MRALLLLLLFPLAVAAQGTGNLAGRVVDDRGDPLPGATVVLEGTQLGAAADINGSYSVVDIPVGQYVVTVLFVGASTRIDTVRINSGYTTEHDFELKLNLATCELDSVYQEEDLSHVRKWLLPAVQPLGEAYGLEPLRGKVSGPRELRLWLFPAYFDKKLIRIVASPDSVRGSAGVGWPLRFRSNYSAEQKAEWLRGTREFWGERQCVDIQSGQHAEMCTFDFVDEINWVSVLNKLEQANLWTLPDESVLPECRYGGLMYIMLDGNTYLIELFDGASYRAYHYSNPRASSPWEEEQNAARIAKVVQDVFSLIQQSAH